ncbi:hypothetical protein JQ628_11405 [Bradyrhizobium lablabi]|uniref:hypothetical protein n=1 Tax=Bradyrhizobium lablabi TaxID=722472 RepID=UPI001BA7DF07|nr:hypothetical protein [Bradyrhizobium lablabi]MBR1122122.1 hypothetical protein [Bradyrhizobium lablabi]
MGELLQLRDYQSKAASERARQALEEQNKINETIGQAFHNIPVFGYHDGIDGLPYTAPDKDPA